VKTLGLKECLLARFFGLPIGVIGKKFNKYYSAAFYWVASQMPIYGVVLLISNIYLFRI
jgi:hypothetical protein